jgi:rhodanese-related sulfurtransferase
VSVPEIDIAELASARDAGARIIDVREPVEWDEVRVPGAELLPLDALPEWLPGLEVDGPLYVICRSGGRSARACEALRADGIDAVNVAGGTLAWIDAGHPTEHGSA